VSVVSGVSMLPYHFSIRDRGTELEELGFDAFDSDAGAIAFGNRIIEDLLRDESKQYFGWIMDIVQGARAVASISFSANN
jgi:hypothetical protein